MTTCWLLWECLTADEQRAIEAAYHLAPIRRLDWEGFSEIDKIMRQTPRGELGRVLAGKEIVNAR